MSSFAAEALKSVRVIIPTYNAEKHYADLSAGLATQGIAPQQVLVIDSSSKDRTAELFKEFGAQVVVIPQSEFNHGGTRRKAAEMFPEAEFLIYLTQDAIPAHPEALLNILAVFENAEVGMAYGRQLPRMQARAIERHARLMNYPDAATEIRSFDDRKKYGVKTVFSSDSFAAYRMKALLDVGNFPEDAFFAEDQITAGRMLMKGWKLAYAGQARVTHSHGYTVKQEFQRYFDVGVFHGRNPWLLESFGSVEGEGLKFIKSEMSFLFRNEPLLFLSAFTKTFAKYFGYRLGRMEKKLSGQTKSKLSMSPHYWTLKKAGNSRHEK